jgi:murein DD-endopeptidase MepM/ murein hydrolase activator NlpD
LQSNNLRRRLTTNIPRVAGPITVTTMILMAAHCLPAAAATTGGTAVTPTLKPETVMHEAAGAAIGKPPTIDRAALQQRPKTQAIKASPSKRNAMAPQGPATQATMGLANSDELAAGETSLVVRPGDTLLTVMKRGGLPAIEIYRDLAKMRKQIDLQNLKPGDRLTFYFFNTPKGQQLTSLRWAGAQGKTASVTFMPSASTPALAAPDAGMVIKSIVVKGTPALPRRMTELNLPPQVREQVVIALSQSKRPPVHGEALKIVYQAPRDPKSTGPAMLHYAAYVGRDGKQRVVRYTPLPTPAPLQYVDVVAATSVALTEPLPGARISSPFGWRVHPVLHNKRFHKGVDFEAAEGTPVLAAADGIIQDIGRRGGYGNYIRVRHTGRLETAYAHLVGFARRLAAGSFVRRGQIIGYVGETGIATGPHLYYEVLVDSRQMDPESVVLRRAARRFNAQVAAVPPSPLPIILP